MEKIKNVLYDNNGKKSVFLLGYGNLAAIF